MKKFVCLLLSAIMFSGALISCDGGKDSVTTDDIGTQSQQNTTAEMITTTAAETTWEETTDTETTEKIPDYDVAHAYVFSNTEEAAEWNAQNADTTLQFGTLKMIPTNHDPILVNYFSESEKFSAEEYHYIAYRYKAKTVLTQGVYFVGSDTNPNFSDSGLTFFDVKNTDKWTSLVTDMKDNNFWNGTITSFRIDPINSGTQDKTAVIYIERIGFFKTKEDARAFLEDAEEYDYSVSSNISGGKQKVIVPTGVLYENFSEADYLLSTDEISGTKVKDELPVVYKTVGGVKTPVAVSYVNAVGFTSYMADTAGEYSVGYPEYTKTGDSALDFVFARRILDSSIDPTDKLSRLQLFEMLYRLAGHTDAEGLAEWVKEKNLSPYDRELTDTTRAVTRDEAAASIYYFLKYLGNTPYTDADYYPNDLDSARFDKSLQLCCGSGIFELTDGGANPRAGFTLSEAAGFIERLVKAMLGQQALPSNVKDDEVLIGGWSHFVWNITDETVKTLAESSINLIVGTGEFEQTSKLRVVLNACEKYGVKLLMHNYGSWTFDANDPEQIPSVCYEFYDYASYLGNYLLDEPGSDHYDMMAEQTAYYNSELPGKLCYYNLLPMYANAAQLKYGASAASIEYYDSDPELYRKYVKAYAEKIPSDYICVDIYPNRMSEGTKLTYTDYLRNMDIFAGVCREYNRDFWLYVQTTGLDGTRVPDYSDMRWQMYVGLSFGVKTFIHFTYGSYSGEWTESMVDMSGKPTSVYTAAQKANLEVTALSEDYAKYENVGAFNYNCKSSTKYLQFDNQYKNFTAITEITSNDPLLFGCFKKTGSDGCAFTVVNMYDLKKPRTAEVSFKLDADYTVTAWIRGEKQTLTPNNGVYTMNLECAEGVFIILDK